MKKYIKIITLPLIILSLCGCNTQQSSQKNSSLNTYISGTNDIKDDFTTFLGENWEIEDDARSSTNTYLRAGYTYNPEGEDMYDSIRIYTSSTATEGFKDSISFTVCHNYEVERLGIKLWYNEALDFFIAEASKMFNIDLNEYKSNSELFKSEIDVTQVQERESQTLKIVHPDGNFYLTTCYDNDKFEFEAKLQIQIKPTDPPENYWQQESVKQQDEKSDIKE